MSNEPNKKQALEALEKLSNWSAHWSEIGRACSKVKQFVESVDSVDLVKRKQKMANKIAHELPSLSSMQRYTIENEISQNIPDTLNTTAGEDKDAEIERLKKESFEKSRELSDIETENIELKNEIERLRKRVNELINHIERLNKDFSELQKLNMELIQLPPKYDPEKKYNESELRELLQFWCDGMNQIPGVEIEIFCSSDKKCLYLRDVDVAVQLSCSIPCTPDLQPPAKGRVVMVRWCVPNSENGDTILLRSCGMFHHGEVLNCEDSHIYHFADEDHIEVHDGWHYWCDYLNRYHHSHGWKKEWEPEK